MTGLSTNIGNQVVSIYSQQELSSIYGNSILNGVLTGGVADASISVLGSAAVTVTIGQNTKLYFTRQATDPVTGEVINIIGKVTIGAAAGFITPFDTTSGTVTYGMSAASWYTNFQSESKLYVVADWIYDATATNKYATIGVYGSAALSSFNFQGVNNQVLIGVLLNNAAAVAQYTVDSTILTSAYHISYEGQTNRDTLPRLYNENNKFLIQQAGDGSGLYVSSGLNFVGDNFIDPAATLNTPEWNNTVTYAGFNYTRKLSFAPAISTYIVNNSSGAQLDITGQESNFNQIDFLRVKHDEYTHTINVVWESFLKPTSPLITFPPTQSQLLSYLSQQTTTSSYTSPQIMNPVFDFPLEGLGQTLLVVVRPRGTSGTYNINTTFWPEYMVVFKDLGLDMTTASIKSIRNKLPVYTSDDLGLV